MRVFNFCSGRYPERLLDDHYLKYLGWTLNDKDTSVRLAVINFVNGVKLAVQNGCVSFFKSLFWDLEVLFAPAT